MARFSERATRPARGPIDLLRWNVIDRITGRSRRDRTPFRPPVREGDAAALADPGVTWIGHASFVARLGGRLVATDPMFSMRMAGALRRTVPPGVALESLPPLDVVTVSHNHMDHMDLPSLRRIGPKALFVVPIGNARFLQRVGLDNVVELDWWQQHRFDGLEITCVPARHWSMRAPWTRNQALWGGFVVRGAEGTLYHSGDTGYFDGFKEIGARLGPIDWACLPIGAYEPRWFLEPQHMNPEEAGQAFLDLGARTMVAMHWGTFRLTDEPLAEPPERIRAFFGARGLDEDRLWILDVGEHRRFSPAVSRG
jgi:L-ascorbate metabolism protein UlaG (beta-lactamase superfamily)